MGDDLGRVRLAGQDKVSKCRSKAELTKAELTEARSKTQSARRQAARVNEGEGTKINKKMSEGAETKALES